MTVRIEGYAQPGSRHGVARAGKPPVVMQFEGEIVDTRPDLFAAAAAVLGRHGLPLPPERIRLLADPWHPAPLVEALAWESGYGLLEDCADLVTHQVLKAFLQRECRNACAVPGALSLLDAYACARVDVHVRSRYPTQFVERALDRFGLLDRVTVLIGAGGNASPHAQLRRLGGPSRYHMPASLPRRPQINAVRPMVRSAQPRPIALVANA